MEKYKIRINKKFGYRVLDPVPTLKELNKFYSEKYYESMSL